MIFKKYFTSDWHLADSRITTKISDNENILFRPFKTVEEANETILNNFCSVFQDGDTLFHAGDVFYSKANQYDLINAKKLLLEIRKKYPSSKFFLTIGNHDEANAENLKFLSNEFFDNITEQMKIEVSNEYFNQDLPQSQKGEKRAYLMNHYANTEYLPKTEAGVDFKLCGHVHGAWRFQENIINVGVDVWHWRPVEGDALNFASTTALKYMKKDKDNNFPNQK